VLVRKLHSPDAEITAISVLAWLASDGERLTRFLSLTGVEPSQVRAVAQDPGFLGAVLDHLLNDESLLQAFAADQGVDPAAISAARKRLPGGQAESGG
jgi:hypothetical protein